MYDHFCLHVSRVVKAGHAVLLSPCAHGCPLLIFFSVLLNIYCFVESRHGRLFFLLVVDLALFVSNIRNVHAGL